MKITRAFSRVFEDPQWQRKLTLLVLWSLIAFIPLLGLVGLAMLVGYTLDMARKVQAGARHPLPDWQDSRARLGDGFNALVAIAVYHLPNALPLSGLTLLFTLGREQGLLLLLPLCSLLVFLMLVWNPLVWLMLAVGATRYTRTGQLTSWFQPGELWDTLRENGSLCLQWLFYSAVAGAALAVPGLLLAPLFGVGLLLAAALSVPVQGSLLGQLALGLEMAEREDEESTTDLQPVWQMRER